MAEKYWSGVGSDIEFTPDATAIEITGISNTGWAVDESNRLAEVSNSQTGNHAVRIACLDDTDGSFEVVWDSNLDPTPNGIYVGATGLLKVFKGTSGNGKEQDIIIEKVSSKASVQQGAVMLTISYKGNGELTDF
jgi:hypothetical protein